jgi:hypothetical protein
MVVDAGDVAEIERQQAFVNALRFRLKAFLRITRPTLGAAERAAAGFAAPTFAPLIRSSDRPGFANWRITRASRFLLR